MKTGLSAACVVILTATTAGWSQSPASKLAPTKGWLTDLQAARTQAEKTGKPLFIVFRCDP